MVYDFYIRKEHRLTGAGKKIVLQLENIAKSNGCQFCMTQVNKKSRGWEEALEFQKKCGMEIIKEYDDSLFLWRKI
jgi:GNAT superfamily N-acetyltransferase